MFICFFMPELYYKKWVLTIGYYYSAIHQSGSNPERTPIYRGKLILLSPLEEENLAN